MRRAGCKRIIKVYRKARADTLRKGGGAVVSFCFCRGVYLVVEHS